MLHTKLYCLLYTAHYTEYITVDFGLPIIVHTETQVNGLQCKTQITSGVMREECVSLSMIMQ